MILKDPFYVTMVILGMIGVIIIKEKAKLSLSFST